MTPDIDIDRAAKLMLDRYGRGATDEARRRAHDLAAVGDIAGAATWRRIGAAVEEFPQVKPAGAAPPH